MFLLPTYMATGPFYNEENIMVEQSVIYAVEGPVATVTLNRPQAMNSMSKDLLHQSVDIFKKIAMEEEVRVVVLTGAGKAFCAGGDLTAINELEGALDRHSYIAKAGELVSVIRDLSKPVIAMVNGVAAGAGFNLTLACDIAIVSSKARFAQSFVNVGLVPDGGGFYSLPRLVGLAKAKELMLTGDLIDAAEALRLGLINKIVEPEELQEVTYKLAKKLAAGPALSMAFIKSTVNKSLESDWETLNSLESSLQALCLATQDNKEGVKAFYEKRAPKFIGK
jgi:2-(1,2-epoxy-1,2-dihydrophenyl)acetyl-CoA isomerase